MADGDYINLNTCRSHTLAATTALQALTGFDQAAFGSGILCSEVLIINKSGEDAYIYDSGIIHDATRLLIEDNESITIRGITNSHEVSAKLGSGTGTIYYRTQRFSNNPSR